MFVPFFSSISSSSWLSSSSRLERRKGGGKGASSSGGKAGKSSASKSTGITSSSSSKTKSKIKTISSSSSSSTKWKSSSTYGGGSVPVAAVIPAGQLFAGRVAGGATRSQIVGTRTYGSGYPGVAGRGTSGRGFPFIFWPIAWPLAVGNGAVSASYLHNKLEYGDPTNSSRPGGPLSTGLFPSLASPPALFRILADNSTISSLIEDVAANCSSYLSSTLPSTSTPVASQPPLAYTPSNVLSSDNATVVLQSPQPHEVIQYYRASTLLLSLDGYNNSLATYSAQEGVVQDAQIPLSDSRDLALLECLNTTIGLAVPLINAGSGLGVGVHANVMGFYRRLEDASSVEEFRQIFLDCLECHYHAYNNFEVLHCDISEYNLMFVRAEDTAEVDRNFVWPEGSPSVRGILIDFDLGLDPNAEGKAPASSANHRTGMLPLVAKDLLEDWRPKYLSPPTHHYRHDLESFFYTLIWVMTQYGLEKDEDGNPIREPLPKCLAGWNVRETASVKKGGFYVSSVFITLEESVLPHFAELWDKWIFNLFLLFRTAMLGAPYPKQPAYKIYDFATHNGQITFETFMEAMGETPRGLDPDRRATAAVEA
ncbi:unnamed protein product [Cyclocybe aegerita]|uniref:Fungal-type protein kinase domain-containing protein n=1 Tax=Cyclocybe aegerita TaxID=1973307 RepID=A0A8S0VXR6_CYCAE|nr:unnamed protein product [Cyclocybe aegerita]